MLSFFQSIVMGILQGITELFPISSLGHGVVFPELFGWHDLVRAQSSPESYFLAFLVGLHVATAIALFVCFRDDWFRILRGVVSSVRTRTIEEPDARLGWLLIVATIPAGILGLALEHTIRTDLAKPLPASIFLLVNGGLLLVGELYRRRAQVRAVAVEHGLNAEGGRKLETLEVREAVVIGFAQALALIPGISRSGITMVTGLGRGLDHEDAAKFSFLLATPIIGAAGLYKLPDLFGRLGDGIRGQVLVGSIAAGLAAFVAVRFLLRYFETRTLLPFAFYCLAIGAALTIYFAV